MRCFAALPSYVRAGGMTAGPAIAQRRLGGFGEGFDEFGEARVVEQVGAGSGGGELDQPLFGLFQAVDGFDPGGVLVRRLAEDVVSGLGFHEARSRMALLGAAPVSRFHVALRFGTRSRVKKLGETAGGSRCPSRHGGAGRSDFRGNYSAK